MLFIEIFFMEKKTNISMKCRLLGVRASFSSSLYLCFSILKNTHWIFAALLANDIKTSRQKFNQ